MPAKKNSTFEEEKLANLATNLFGIFNFFICNNEVCGIRPFYSICHLPDT